MILLKTIEPRSALALRTVMRTPSADNNLLDGSFAEPAGFAGSLVDAMLQLEEAFDPFGIHVVGNRGAAHLDGLPEYGLQAGAEPFQFCS